MNQNLDEILANAADTDFVIGMDIDSLPDAAVSEAIQDGTVHLCRRFSMSYTETMFYAAAELLIRSGQGDNDEKRSLLTDVFQTDGDDACHDAFYKIEETRAMFSSVETACGISVAEEPADPLLRAVSLGWQRYAHEESPDFTPNQQLFLDVYETLLDLIIIQKCDANDADLLAEALDEVNPFASEEEFEREQKAILRVAGMQPDEWDKLFDAMKEMYLLDEMSALMHHISEALGAENKLTQEILRINAETLPNETEVHNLTEPDPMTVEIENPRLRKLLGVLQDTAHHYATDGARTYLSALLHKAIEDEAEYEDLDGDTLRKKLIRTACAESEDQLASLLLGLLVDEQSSQLSGRLFLRYPDEPALGDSLERIYNMYHAECKYIRRSKLHENLLAFLDRRAKMGALEYDPTGCFQHDVRHLLAQVIRVNYPDLLDEETSEEAAAEFLAQCCTVQAAS